MATVQNIVINQNADYSKQFTAKDDTGTVIDLTGKTVSAKLRKSYGSSTATAFTVATVSATAGTFTLALTDVQDAYGTLDRGRYVYDVELILADSTIEKAHYGVVTVHPEATKV